MARAEPAVVDPVLDDRAARRRGEIGRRLLGERLEGDRGGGGRRRRSEPHGHGGGLRGGRRGRVEVRSQQRQVLAVDLAVVVEIALRPPDPDAVHVRGDDLEVAVVDVAVPVGVARREDHAHHPVPPRAARGRDGGLQPPEVAESGVEPDEGAPGRLPGRVSLAVQVIHRRVVDQGGPDGQVGHEVRFHPALVSPQRQAVCRGDLHVLLHVVGDHVDLAVDRREQRAQIGRRTQRRGDVAVGGDRRRLEDLRRVAEDAGHRGQPGAQEVGPQGEPREHGEHPVGVGPELVVEDPGDARGLERRLLGHPLEWVRGRDPGIALGHG